MRKDKTNLRANKELGRTDVWVRGNGLLVVAARDDALQSARSPEIEHFQRTERCCKWNEGKRLKREGSERKAVFFFCAEEKSFLFFFALKRGRACHWKGVVWKRMMGCERMGRGEVEWEMR